MKRHLASLGGILALAAGTAILAGQGEPLRPGTPRMPAPAMGAVAVPAPALGLLKVEDADPAAQKAVGLEAIEIRAVLNGPLAQTTVTMTFRNSLNRVLEGELEFPLPEGASIVGYGLDVPAGSGNLVEGVCVEKERARQIFESEERRGVDPGIVEQTRGNNYRTRVHPIPAGGTRTLQLTYVSDMGSGTYRLPMDFVGAVKKATIRVEAIGVKAGELKVAGLEMATGSESGNVVAEKSLANVSLGGELVVTLPKPADLVARVETRTKPMTLEQVLHPETAKTETQAYFLIAAEAGGVINAERALPRRLGIIWDTNLSRASMDKSAEIAAVRALIERVKNVDVYLRTPEHFVGAFHVANGESSALVNAIEGLTYDGALRIDRIVPGISENGKGGRESLDAELFVSNGLVTLGENHFALPGDGFSGEGAKTPRVPVYTISADVRADHAVLEALARETGGLYVNLQQMKAEQLATAVLGPQLVMSVEGGEGVEEIYPRGAVPVVAGARALFTGKLTGDSGMVKVNYGVVGGKMTAQEVKLSRAQAGMSGMVPRFWAQQNVAELERAGAVYADQVVMVAKEFNLVTPETSLMVLETVDQYVRYHVVPPKSRPEVYREFEKRIEEEGKQQRQEEAGKIEHVLALWKGRTEWWETKFAAPSKEQLIAKQQAAKSDEAGRMMSSAAPSTNGLPALNAPTTGPGYANVQQMQNQVLLPDATPSLTATQPGTPRASMIDINSASEEQLAAFGDSHVPGFSRADEVLNDLSVTGAIKIRPWTPDTPYLRAMAGVAKEKMYGVYLEQRKTYAGVPSFYLDCGNFLIEHGQREEGVRVLTDIAQLQLENSALLRVAAYRLLQVGQYDLAIDLFEGVKQLRPDEPQSWRDLALAVSEEALQRSWNQNELNIAMYHGQMDDLMRAMNLYAHVVMNKWDRFDEIELVALMEANELWAKMQRMDGWRYVDGAHTLKNPLDPRLVKNLDCDVRIVMTWDADNTDIDLHVMEPTGEEAFYSNNRTLAGGLVSHDFTQGYGPEEYLIHHAVPGVYKVMANYFGTRQQSLQGPVTVQATVITNFGRPDEKRQEMTLRLTDQKETVPIGEVMIGK